VDDWPIHVLELHHGCVHWICLRVEFNAVVKYYGKRVLARWLFGLRLLTAGLTSVAVVLGRRYIHLHPRVAQSTALSLLKSNAKVSRFPLLSFVTSMMLGRYSVWGCCWEKAGSQSCVVLSNATWSVGREPRLQEAHVGHAHGSSCLPGYRREGIGMCPLCQLLDAWRTVVRVTPGPCVCRGGMVTVDSPAIGPPTVLLQSAPDKADVRLVCSCSVMET
jgi:hypothetical protein